MSKTIFTLKELPAVPLEAENFTPDVMAALSQAEVCALPLLLGNRRCRMDDFFDVEGAGSDHLELRGDAGRVKWIGRGMTRGRIVVVGNVGMHLGAYMKGGAIEVAGSASDWVGAEMTGGLIRIEGDAGGQIGAAYRGSPTGMRGGTILVGGSAGMEIGMRMRRGVIAVRGPALDFAGLQMKGGTLVLMGGAAIRTGAWMVRGTIISLKPLQLLPTFSYACAFNPVFVRLYAKELQAMGFPLPMEDKAGTFQRFTGDAIVPGKGEILVWQPRPT